VRTRTAVGLRDAPSDYAVLLSPEARLVRIITGADPAPAVRDDLPRVIGPESASAVLQWIGAPGDLPTLIAPERTQMRSRRTLN